MKKKIALLLTLALTASVYARDNKNELALSYSQFTLPQAAYVFGSVFGIAFSLGSLTLEKMALPGALSLEYTHYVNDTFGFGGTVTGDYMTADKYTGKDENKTYDGKFQMAFISAMPHVKAFWFNNPHFGMYSKAAVGAACVLQKDGEPSVTWAAQLSPVCMDFGGDSVRGYLELGAGMQGIVTLGIKKMF